MMKRKQTLPILTLPAVILLGAVSAWASALPSDPYFAQQWSLHNDGSQEVSIDVDQYHTIHQKGVVGSDIGWLEAQPQVSQLAKAPVTVAVIDSGVDPDHPELQGRIAPDGYNFLKDNPKSSTAVFDDMGHGTHVTGIIVANSDNKAGIAGAAASTVKVLPLRILSENFINFSFVGKLVSDYAADAINYAVAHHASVINMSLGWPKIVDTDNARKAVQNAIQKGVLIVAAAGNDRKNEPTYPCDYPGVLCVGATSNTGESSVFSNTGGSVDLLAPGDDIISLYPLKVESRILRIQGYELLSGTSQAAPLVSAAAATIRSAYPNISLDELKARLLASSAALPKQNTSLYGMVHLKHALEAAPQAVFLPDFKGNDSVTVDEKNLQAQGQISVRNLWADSNETRVEVTVNGQSAGNATPGTVKSGQSVVVPWRYSFSSLDDSSLLQIKVRVSNTSGLDRSFTLELPAVRSTGQMQSAQSVALSGSNWIGSAFGHLYSRFNQVPFYPSRNSAPAYYQLTASSIQGSSFQIFDPASTTPVKSVSIPGIAYLNKIPPQLIRLDANFDGKLDWVAVGLAQDAKATYLQFYFMNADFQPLYGSADASTWKLAIDARFAQILVRNYATSGSWVRSGNQLVPAFLDFGVLPDPDNYRPLSQLHYKSDTHFYYLLPKQGSKGPVDLEIRALDGADFRTKYGSISLLNMIPQSAKEQAQGHFRILVGNGDSLDAKTTLIDLRSVGDYSYSEAQGWDSISSNSQPVPVMSASSLPVSAGFLNFFDGARGSFAWSTPEGSVSEDAEFTFQSIDNPIQGLIGAIDLGALGRYTFYQARFDIVAFTDTGNGQSSEPKILPIENDSSFPGQQFSEMFSPIVVGTSQKPQAGIYIDSTLVRGNLVSIATLNSENGSFSKPLRYSLLIPEGCVQMAPAHQTDAPDSLVLPFFCQTGNQTEFRTVQIR